MYETFQLIQRMHEIFKPTKIHILKHPLWMGESGNFIIMTFIHILWWRHRQVFYLDIEYMVIHSYFIIENIHQLTITDNHWMEYYGWVEIPRCTCCQNATRGRKQDLLLCQCGWGKTISTSLINAWLQYMRCRINFCGRHDLAASLFFLGTAYHWNVS